MPLISSDDYVKKGGNHCPNCGCTDIETSPMQTDAGIAWQSCTCDDCGMHYTDEYKLTGYDIED